MSRTAISRTSSGEDFPVWLYGELNRARNDFLHGKSNHGLSTDCTAGQASSSALCCSPIQNGAHGPFLDLTMERRPPRENETDYEAFLAHEHEFWRVSAATSRAAIATNFYSRKKNIEPFVPDERPALGELHVDRHTENEKSVGGRAEFAVAPTIR